jgi:hypothetical protein
VDLHPTTPEQNKALLNSFSFTKLSRSSTQIFVQNPWRYEGTGLRRRLLGRDVDTAPESAINPDFKYCIALFNNHPSRLVR